MSFSILQIAALLLLQAALFQAADNTETEQDPVSWESTVVDHSDSKDASSDSSSNELPSPLDNPSPIESPSKTAEVNAEQFSIHFVEDLPPVLPEVLELEANEIEASGSEAVATPILASQSPKPELPKPETLPLQLDLDTSETDQVATQLPALETAVSGDAPVASGAPVAETSLATENSLSAEDRNIGEIEVDDSLDFSISMEQIGEEPPAELEPQVPVASIEEAIVETPEVEVVAVPWAATRNANAPISEMEPVSARPLSQIPSWDSGEALDLSNAINSRLEIVNGNANAAFEELESPPWRAQMQQASFQSQIVVESVDDLQNLELDEVAPADINDPTLQGGEFAGGDGNLFAGGDASAMPNAIRENPGWWIQALQQPLLSKRQLLPTNIDEVMFVALKNSPQVQILNARPIIQETFIGEANAQFDWTQFVQTTWNEIDEPIGSELTTGNQGRFLQREWTLDAGLRRQLKNGGSLSFTQRYGTLDNNSRFLDPPDQGNARLFLDYRQPLLRNRGRRVNMSQIALASLDFETVSGESRTALQEYLVSVVRSYWNVYFRRAALVINRRGLERGKELLRQLRLRDGIDVRNDQLLRAEAAVASRRSDVIRAEYELVNAQDQLINASVGPKYLAGTPEQIEFLPVAFDLPLGVQFDPTVASQSAVYNRPEIQQSIAQLRAAAIRNQVSQNQILPRLDAVLTASANGLRGDKDFRGAFGDQFSQGNPSYSAGFEFEMPVGNRAARYRAERAQMEMTLANREFENQVGNVLVDARIASREVSRLNSENQNNWAALLKANEELFLIQERQRLQLDDGKVGSLYIEDLLASQARLTAAEIRLAQSQTEQAVALVDLKRAVGVLVSGGKRSPRVLECSPSYMPGANVAMVEDAESTAWLADPKFDSEVVPAVGDAPVSLSERNIQPVANEEMTFHFTSQGSVSERKSPTVVSNGVELRGPVGGFGYSQHQTTSPAPTGQQAVKVKAEAMLQSFGVRPSQKGPSPSVDRSNPSQGAQAVGSAGPFGGFGFPQQGPQKQNAAQPVSFQHQKSIAPTRQVEKPKSSGSVSQFFGFRN